MKTIVNTLLIITLLSASLLEAGISKPVTPKTKKGKSKLKVKNVEMIPSLASELSYTNILVILNSNIVTTVAAGPCAMKGKFKKKTGEAKSWKYKEKTKDPKYKLTVKVSPKKNSLKLKESEALPTDVLIYAAGKAAIVSDMKTVPGGKFYMGASNSYYISHPSKEDPVHEVDITEFKIEEFEVSNGQMCRVMQWAYDNGHVSASASTLVNNDGDQQTLIGMANYACDIKFADGRFFTEKGRDGFPCSVATWYGAAAYCNYKSLMEGLQPCIAFADWTLDITKNGYRLPTEAEWEKAARGGLVANWFPWPSASGTYESNIDGSKANYFHSGGIFDHEVSVCGYYNGGQTPDGIDMKNGYGLYDMAGNLDEWCWDWYDNEYYQTSPASDPEGPPKGFLTSKVVRGGRWGDPTHMLRCAYRDDSILTSTAFRGTGFRCVKRD